MISKNNNQNSQQNKNNQQNGNSEYNINSIDKSQDLIDLSNANTNLLNLDELDELEESYLYFINDKISKKESIYSPRPPKKNIYQTNNSKLSASLRKYKEVDKSNNILNNPPKKLVFNKTMIISPFKPILEESIISYTTKTERHYSLPNIKFENISYNTNDQYLENKLNYSKFKLPNINNSLNLSNLNNSKIEIKSKSNNVYNNTNSSFKNLSKGNNTIINKDGHYIFKSNYRLKKYLVKLHSSNFNVNNILEKCICKRMSITQETEEWVWYNLKYQYSFNIKYNIDNYGNTGNYSVFIKYGKKTFNIDNLLISEDI